MKLRCFNCHEVVDFVLLNNQIEDYERRSGVLNIGLMSNHNYSFTNYRNHFTYIKVFQCPKCKALIVTDKYIEQKDVDVESKANKEFLEYLSIDDEKLNFFSGGVDYDDEDRTGYSSTLSTLHPFRNNKFRNLNKNDKIDVNLWKEREVWKNFGTSNPAPYEEYDEEPEVFF